jgi:hypothetical protein
MLKLIIGSAIAGASAVIAYRFNKRLVNNNKGRIATIEADVRNEYKEGGKLEAAPPFLFGYVEE